MQQNLDRVKNSHTFRNNSQQYDNMSAELKACAEAKSPEELDAAKGRLAQRAKEYLDHTGLGRASKIHANAEPRRELAFLMLNKTNKDLYANYAKRANSERGAADKIDAARLSNKEGIGRPMPQVRDININELTGKVPENRPAQPKKKSPAQKKPVTINPDKGLQEPKAPSRESTKRINLN